MIGKSSPAPPQFPHLAKVEQSAVFAVLDDGYLDGLVITDIDLVKGFFQKIF
jgi:hypothetical protein